MEGTFSLGDKLRQLRSERNLSQRDLAHLAGLSPADSDTERQVVHSRHEFVYCLQGKIMDSSGLKIFGEGEWKVCAYGKSKRRTWRKLHLAVDMHQSHRTNEIYQRNPCLVC